MAKHRKYDLLELITQAIYESGWNVIHVSDVSAHPFLLKIYNATESYLVRIYIWNLTHGGGSARPKDDYRIQITGVNRFVQQNGEKTLILGWWKEAGVFAGFDFYKHDGTLGASPSIQIREENLRKALIYGFSACDRGNGEIAIAFSPDFFVEYVRSLEALHKIGQTAREVALVEEIIAAPIEVNDQSILALSKQRQTTIKTVLQRLRESNFKKRVLTAYGHQCAFSGMQLKLVDAAHIIPVSVENATDETCNGIALSALYHRAYDQKLITFNEKYQIIVNQDEIKKLAKLNLDGGAENFIRDLRPVIVVPPAVNDRPNINYITAANKLRGWIL